MTFSIVGREGDAFGVAVASKFLAIGAVAPASQARVGAVATQAWANVAYRPDGLALLKRGHSSTGVVAALIGADAARDQRQVAVVSPSGAMTFTGAGCHDWAGGRSGNDYAIQGNLLTGPDVIHAMERSWLESQSRCLDERLLTALIAGDQAGGDRRGRQSAALVVSRPGAGYGGADTEIDLRVDDHLDPVAELKRLRELHQFYFGAPDSAALLPLTAEIADEVRSLLTQLGYTHEDIYRSLNDWAGAENFEERLRPGAIDPVVLAQLRLGRT